MEPSNQIFCNFNLTKISVTGLHGNKNISIDINNNIFLLVGVNGLGKTTLINIVYALMSRQWDKLKDINFETIELKFKDRKFKISKDDINDGINFRKRRHRGQGLFPFSMRQELDANIEIRRILIKNKLTNKDKNVISNVFRIHSDHIERFHSDARIYLGDIEPKYQQKLLDPFQKLEDYLAKNVNCQILYLPTYRRIEKDLKTIFPKFEEDMRAFQQKHRRSQRIYQRSSETFVELVEFGMEDVEQRIRNKLLELSHQVRSELNSLNGSYLSDVIRGEDKFDEKAIKLLDDEMVEKIINRVDEATLNAQDKSSLRKVIEIIQTGNADSIDQNQRFTAHFFGRLVNSHYKLTKFEAPVTEFANVCNKYLEGKFYQYDNKNFELNLLSSNLKNIELQELSSGEKQIVSLFSHLYLSNQNQFFILIDEPELSLSVPWQESFLPDILRTKKCAFIAAATHSPFIFHNELEQYAVDMKKCTKIKK